MGLAVNVHPRPAVADDVDVSGMDVLVLLNEVCAEDGAEQLGGVNGVLFGGNVNGVLDGVGCDNDTVVGLGVTVKSSVVSQTFKGLGIDRR